MFKKDKQGLVEILYKGEIIAVSKEVADYLEECRLDLRRQSEKKRRNHAAITFEEDFVEELMAIPPIGFENELFRELDKERLPGLIAKLPEIQRRRLVAYYYEGLTYQEIGKREGVDHRAVMRSVESGVSKLKKYF